MAMVLQHLSLKLVDGLQRNMGYKTDFEFLNDSLWLEFTQQRYVPLKDIKYRLNQREPNQLTNTEWIGLRDKIQNLRKMGSIPFFVKSIDKKFWFFPSDSIQEKIHWIEFEGNALYEQIKAYGAFKEEFLTNAKIEEAVTSAIYEGANSTRSKARAMIASQKSPVTKSEWMLINNYEAMKWINENSFLPLNLEAILKIHNIVTQNTLDGDDAHFQGKFRNDTVHVGDHEGVKFTLIEDSLNEVLQLTTQHPRSIHPLLRGILLHYFTAYIHPFFDGNGRTARTLFYFKAIKNNLKFVELLSVSAALKEIGRKYEKSFDLVVEHELDMTYFIDFCLDSLILSLKQVKKKVEYLISLSNLKESHRLNSQQVSLLQKMALNKFRHITIEEYAASIEKSREVARIELKDLKDKGFLIEQKKGKKLIYYIDSKRLKEKLKNSI